MNDVVKGMIIFALILLIVSPLDFVPGPVDDIIMILLAVACKRYPNGMTKSDHDDCSQDLCDGPEHFEW